MKLVGRTQTDLLKRIQQSEQVLLVDESSGTLDGCIKISRPCDHFEINKFVSTESETWQELAELLMDMSNKSQTQNAKRPEKGVSRRSKIDTSHYKLTVSRRRTSPKLHRKFKCKSEAPEYIQWWREQQQECAAG